jgi:hypothetical protein
MYPPSKAKMDETVKRYTALKTGVQYRKDTSEESADPSKETRVYNIDILMKRAKPSTRTASGIRPGINSRRFSREIPTTPRR